MKYRNNQTFSWQPWAFQYSYFYVSLKENLYYLALGNKPVLARSQKADENNSWVGSQIVTNSSGIFFFEEGQETWSVYDFTYGYITRSNRIVNVTEISKDWTYFNIENNGTFVSQVRSGVLQICPAGCADCNCTTCFTGYGKNNDTGLCVKCPPGCSICNASNITDCQYSCITGYTSNYTTKACDICSSACLSCYFSTSSCGSCLPN